MTVRKRTGHPVGDAAEDAAVVVGGSFDLTILDAERVVCLAARLGGKAKAKPEFNPFDCRDAEHQRSNAAFDAVEHRVADAGRQSDGGTFDDTAHRILSVAAVCNELLHLFSGSIIKDREEFFLYRQQGGGRDSDRVEGVILHRANRADVRADLDAVLTQVLFGNRTGKAQRSGQTTGKMSAATDVVAAVVAP